jgi:DNA-directed RNA polymerase II subunit RPB2
MSSLSFSPVECEYATNEQCQCKHCTSLSSEDISWRLIKTYFDDKGYVKSQIINYNELIYKFIPEVITRLGSFTVVNGSNTFVWTVKTPTFGLPYVKEYEGEYRFVTPAECRLRSLNYESPLYANMEIEYKTALATHKSTIEKVLIGHIPVMLKSALCSLNNKTETQMAELGECMYDHGGYFIINGGEKVLIAQERMAHNQVFCYQEKTGEFTAELRSVPEGVSKAATQVTVKYHYQTKNSLKNLQNHRLSVKLHYTKKEIPIMIVFKALGVLDENEILKMIHPELNANPQGNEKLAQIYQMCQASFEEASIITTQDIALRYVGMNTNIPIQGAEKQIEYAKNVVLIKEMFPHLGVEEKNCVNKAFLLGHMVYKCLLTAIGERDVDDRDHFGNKRIDLAGNLIGNIFRISFTRVMKDFKKLIEKKLAQGKVINLKNEFDSESITKSIRNSIATGNWGSGNSKSNRTGVTQPLHRLTYISTLCHIRRLVAPIAKEGKNPKPRQLHNSLYARTCKLAKKIKALSFN